MRVLTLGNMYPPHHLGGYELMWESTVAHLRSTGHEVRVVTTDYRAPGVEAAGDPDVRRELRWYWHDHEFPRLGPRAMASLERHNSRVLTRHLTDFRPDAISWWAMGGMSLSLIEAARRRGIPAMFAVVDDWLLYGSEVDQWIRRTARLGPLRPVAERAVGVPAALDLLAAGRWLFASQTLVRRAEEHGLTPPDPAVAHPGIDHGLFRDPRAAREDWSWRLLYCGRIDPRKGIDLAIRALGELPGEATLRVIGGGDETHLAELHALVARLGMTERVRFDRVAREAIPDAYREADATLFPVLWEEPFGLVPLESMAVGTPVVASGRGGSSEYLRDAENCVIFDPDGGAAALAAAIEKLADSPDLREGVHAEGLRSAAAFTDEDFDRAVETELRRARSSAQ